MTKIIAIDGPAAVGKTMIAKKISKKYKSPVLYSGKLYRAVAIETIKRKINPQDIRELLKCASLVKIDNISNEELYSKEVDYVSSIISTRKELRNKLIRLQRNFPIEHAKKCDFAIIEGRDIGSIIFPNADYKIFLWANPEIRAKRRYDQHLKNKRKISYRTIYNEINKRDRKDLTRKIAPLMPAVNSVLLDTSYLDIEQVFNAIKNIISNR